VAGAENEGGFGFVAGIENAPELFVAGQKCIGFVNEQSGRKFCDDAEESGWADVGGRNRPMDKFGKEREQSCFAAAFEW